MKSLEEQVEEFLKDKKIPDFEVWNEDANRGWDLSILLEEFATEKVKAALQEAAEKVKTKGDCTYWNCHGESVDKESILSLIPKEHE